MKLIPEIKRPISQFIHKQITLLLLLLLAIVLFVTLRSIYLIISKEGKLTYSSRDSVTVTPTKHCIYTPYPSSTPTPIPTLPAPNFQKRLFNPKETISSDIPYPAEVINIPESQLIGLDCKRFTDDSYSEKEKNKADYYLNYIYDVPNQRNGLSAFYPLSNTRYIKLFLKAAEDSPKSNLRSITFCQTEDNRLLIEYEAVPQKTKSQNISSLFDLVHIAYAGGGGGNDVYIAEATKEDNLRRIAYLPVQPSAYWGCRSPLELTKNNIFYLLCGGGDGGGYGTASFLRNIYKIDISSGTYTEILSCTNKLTPDNKIQNQCM